MQWDYIIWASPQISNDLPSTPDSVFQDWNKSGIFTSKVFIWIQSIHISLDSSLQCSTKPWSQYIQFRFQVIHLLDTQSGNGLICMNILPAHETILASSSSTAHGLHSCSCCSMKCISSRSLGNTEYGMSKNFQWKLTHRSLVDRNTVLQFSPDLGSCWQQPILFCQFSLLSWTRDLLVLACPQTWEINGSSLQDPLYKRESPQSAQRNPGTSTIS